jgi:hypothetical protein
MRLSAAVHLHQLSDLCESEIEHPRRKGKKIQQKLKAQEMTNIAHATFVAKQNYN